MTVENPTPEEIEKFYLYDYFLVYHAIIDGETHILNNYTPTYERIRNYAQIMTLQGLLRDFHKASAVVIVDFKLLGKRRQPGTNPLILDFKKLPQIGRDEQLIQAVKMRPEGYVLEFGVAGGATIKTIATHAKQTVYGFDWFKGLPSVWYKDEKSLAIGTYATEKPDFIEKNIVIVDGLFQDTLEDWKDENQDPIGFIHMDADLYSSTIYVLETLNDQIKSGTIIVFDELFELSGANEYPNWDNEGEWKALEEWVREYDRTVEPISRTDYAGCIRVIE